MPRRLALGSGGCRGDDRGRAVGRPTSHERSDLRVYVPPVANTSAVRPDAMGPDDKSIPEIAERPYRARIPRGKAARTDTPHVRAGADGGVTFRCAGTRVTSLLALIQPAEGGCDPLEEPPHSRFVSFRSAAEQ